MWIDGSVLDRTQAGYFSLVSELIRSLLGQPSYVVHVVASQAGAAALKGRIGDAGASLHVHEPDWRLRIVDRLGWPAAPGATRIGLWLRRRLMAPAGRPPVPKTVELLVWRGRFRWASSRRIAIVQIGRAHV